jgi:hypothetical protein
VQTRLWSREAYHDAIRPLRLLSTLYTETGVAAEKERITQMLHWTGQHMIREEKSAPRAFPVEPPIGPRDPESAADAA